MSVRGGSGSKDSGGGSAYDAVGYGMTFAASALLFFAAGVWADGRLGTSPLFAFAGLLVGGAAGFWWMYARITGINAPPNGGDEPPDPGADA